MTKQPEMSNDVIRTRDSTQFKILAGFGAVISVFVLGAGLTFYNLTHVSTNVHQFAEIAKEAGLAAHIEAKFAKMSAHAREFASRGKESDAEKVQSIAAEIQADIEALKQREIPDTLVGRVTEIETSIAAYNLDFADAAVLERELKSLVKDTMLPNGALLVADMDKMQEEFIAAGNLEAALLAGTAREHLLLLQIHSNTLLGHKDTDVAALVEEEIVKSESYIGKLETVATTPRSAALFAEVTALFSEYREALQKAHKDEVMVREIVDGSLQASADHIIHSAEAFLADATALEAQIEEDVLAEVFLAEIEVAVASLVSFGLGVTIAMTLGRGMSKSVVTLTQVMGRLAKHDTSVEVPGVDRRDEFGLMARAVEVFKTSMIENDAMAEAQKADREAREARARQIEELTTAFDDSVRGMLDKVAAATGDLDGAAQSMTQVAEQTMEQSTMVASASEEATANVQTVAAATEELSSSIQEISNQVGESTRIAKEAAETAQTTRTAVSTLEEAALEVGQIVGLISEIAEQTNLLALNATIEAARAGDAGRGFAVVATEVKSLADQTGKATVEISGKISQIQGQTTATADAIRQISETVVRLDEISSAIAAAVEEQSSATQEIGRSVQEAAQGTQEVSIKIEDVSTGAQSTSSAAVQVRASSGAVSEQSEGLRSQIDRFLAAVRAA